MSPSQGSTIWPATCTEVNPGQPESSDCCGGLARGVTPFFLDQSALYLGPPTACLLPTSQSSLFSREQSGVAQVRRTCTPVNKVSARGSKVELLRGWIGVLFCSKFSHYDDQNRGAEEKRSLTFVYLDKQGASALHSQSSPNHSLNKASLCMACPSTHLTLPQVVNCHTEIEPNFFATEHN
jgi:hypothetical protein